MGKIPEVTHTYSVVQFMNEHQVAIGETTWGGLEALEANFALSGISIEALRFFGLADQSAFNGVFRGAFRSHKGEVSL